MNQGKIDSALSMAKLRLDPPQPSAAVDESKTRPRHAAITHDIYSYRGYKHWMNRLRASWDRS